MWGSRKWGECGCHFPPWESVFPGQSDSSQQCTFNGVLLELRRHGGEENHLALCLHGDQAFSKRVNFGILQCIPDAGERSKNRLWSFSQLVHWHPVDSAFPGSCQTRNFGMSFCRYFLRRSEFGLQLNYKVKPLLWCAEMFLDFLVLLMIHCQALKLNEL